jgi:hypothetical protein
MIKFFCLLPLCFAFIGCATPSPTYPPSGEQGYTVTCSGKDLNGEKDFEKARDICGR